MLTRAYALAMLAALAACGPLPGQTPPPIVPGLSKSVDQALCQLGFTRVPLRETRTGHHLVEVTINGRPATFIVDTGANVTVLNAALAEPFALTPRVGVVGAAVGIGGSLGAKQWNVKELAVGGVPVRQNHIATADLSGVVGALSRMSEAQIAGIVGQDVLKAQQAVIDVDGPTLHMLQANAAPRPPEACESAT